MSAVDHWPDKRLTDEVSHVAVDALSIIIDDARDERPIQEFLARNPALLRGLLPSAHRVWCFDRPRLGGEYVPDFLLCRENSMGFLWTLIELESPRKRALTAAGVQSSPLSVAFGQIGDWRAWVRQNVAYAQSELGFRGLDAEAQGIVVLGRRVEMNSRSQARYREISTGRRDIVMSYDRLLDACEVSCAGGTR